MSTNARQEAARSRHLVSYAGGKGRLWRKNTELDFGKMRRSDHTREFWFSNLTTFMTLAKHPSPLWPHVPPQ
jgi:hypothetical protein